ncbi:MAG: hypothetical protein HY360_10595 [Verrucomicrobia bacterium]|nr:hypothetical protein [Verrucomicrobiota bacterium]
MIKKRKKGFAFVNEYINEYELKLGEGRSAQREWIVNHPNPLGPELPYLKKHRLGKGINVVHDYWGCLDEKQLDEIIAYADYISVDSRVITPEHFDLFLRKMRDHPHKLYHRVLIECDTRANWDQHDGFFRSHQEAMEWWKDFVLHSQCQWTDPVTHTRRFLRDMRSDLLPGGNMLEYIKRGMPCREFHLPWFGYKDRKEALKQGADRRLQEKGVLADTRFGDIVDVLVDTASVEALSAYPLVIVLGGLVLQDHHFEVLERYVCKGGTLLLNAMHFPPQKTAFGGFTVEAGYQWYEGKTTCKLCDLAINDYLYEYSAIKPRDGARVLMRTEEDYAGFPPLAVERSLGKGRIITSLVYHYNILKGEQLASSVQHLLDHLIEPLIPYHVTGGPIQTIFSESEHDANRQYVTLLNQHERSWQGTIRHKMRKITDATDVISGEKMSITNHKAAVAVEPFGVRVVRVALDPE